MKTTTSRGWQVEQPQPVGPEIPRIVHYCSFGGTSPQLPPRLKRCLPSWQRHLGDYEFRRWDESNSPTHIDFVRATLEDRYFSKASDAVRLYALHQYGGIYLDTDVEVLASFDSLLGLEAFLGFQFDPRALGRRLNQSVNGAVFGARPGHPFVAAALDRLVETLDGSEISSVAGPKLLTELLMERGLSAYSDVPIVVDGVTIFPKDYFYPHWANQRPDPSLITDRTLAVHYWAGRWGGPES